MSDAFLVLGQLDNDTILAATDGCFVIKEKVRTANSETWRSKYFYVELGDAIRGYARCKLHDPELAQRVNGSLSDLIDTINKLENTIKDIGIKLTTAWTTRVQDPVESHLFTHGVKVC